MKDIHSLEQGNKSVEVYFHKLKGLWDEYTVLEPTVPCSCGSQKTQVDREQKRKLLQFLMGLHESNATVRGQILMMNPLPSLSQAYAYVKQDEKARQGYQSLVPAASPVSNALLRSSASPDVTTNNKKLPPTNPAKSVIKCSHCNYNGHTKEQCFKLIGYPPNWKKKKEISGVASSPAGQFRPLPKANQANVCLLYTSPSPRDRG